MTDPIRIFVGSAANGEDAESQAVLEYTLRRHASLQLEITWMALSRDPASPFYSEGPRGWQTKLWATPFSGLRWALPSLCQYRGRAIYMDSDVIVRADIAELWRQEIPAGACVLARRRGGWRLCVSLWDCAAAAAQVGAIVPLKHDPLAHGRLTQKFATDPRLVAPFAGRWNCLDGEDLALDHPDVKAIHYTSMPHQPHLRIAMARLAANGRRHWFDGEIRPHWRPDLVALFEQLLGEAIAAGYLPSNYEPAEPFGDYAKKSLKAISRSVPAHGRTPRPGLGLNP